MSNTIRLLFAAVSIDTYQILTLDRVGHRLPATESESSTKCFYDTCASSTTGSALFHFFMVCLSFTIIPESFTPIWVAEMFQISVDSKGQNFFTFSKMFLCLFVLYYHGGIVPVVSRQIWVWKIFSNIFIHFWTQSVCVRYKNEINQITK